jgi:SPOR domain
MIRILGSLGLRLWIVVLLAPPVCFYLLPMISTVFPGVHPAVPGGILLMSLGVGVGLALDFMGRARLESLMKEGEIWERAGVFSRAEKTYENAVRIYDSSLVSCLFAKKIGIRLAGTLARFSLTAGIERPYLTLASAVYLRSSPGDEILAILWLERLKKKGGAESIEQEVLTALANIHYTHQRLVILLADVLLDLGRMDYSAKRVYKTLLDDPELGQNIKTDFQEKIHGLIGIPQAQEGESAENIGNTGLDRVVFTSPDRGDSKTQNLKSALSLLKRFPDLVRQGGIGLGAALGFCIHSLRRAIVWVKKRERVRFYIRAGAMGVLSVWLLFFMVSTISHILTGRAKEKHPPLIEIQVPKPFTIQVAAYLKQIHADRYAAILKQKGIAPIITKVEGGGKTWYVVKISEFPDKVSAAAFGEKLKAEKIIDDFFVSNK